VLNGGAGTDTADYSLAGTGVTVEIWKGTVANDGQGGTDTLIGIENAFGTQYNDTLVGDEGANALYGNTGNDTLKGGGASDALYGEGGNDDLYGGSGNDTLNGGAGADHFVFDSAPGAGNVDQIMDFSLVDDTLALDNAIFTSLGTPGALAAGMLVSGAAAADGNDFLLYNTGTGVLSYDADADGPGPAQPFVTLVGAPAVAEADLLVV